MRTLKVLMLEYILQKHKRLAIIKSAQKEVFFDDAVFKLPGFLVSLCVITSSSLH